MEKKAKIVAILLIGIGFFLRIWRLRELMGFDYDQEVAVFAVNRILSGDLTLIGQEISIGGVFIGPGYYYLLAFFYWLFAGDPIGVGVMVAIISVATMILIFTLTREFFDSKIALIALLIYATSARINFYDRTTAPSNPLMLISLLTIFLLWKARSGQSWMTPLIVLTVAGASIHLHPSAFVLAPLAVVLWKIWKLPKPSPKEILASLAAFIAVISPLIFFDLRHNRLITKGMLAALKSPGEEAYPFFFKLLINLRIQVENLISLVNLERVGVVFAIAGAWLWVTTKSPHKKILILWILFPAFVMSFYSRHIPEYYFLVSFPALVIILAKVAEIIENSFSKVIGIFVLLAIVVSNVFHIAKMKNPMSLKYKEEAIHFINNSSEGNAVVSFDTDSGLEAGFRFLLNEAGIQLATGKTQPTHTIVIPIERRSVPGREKIFGGIKVIESSR